MDNDFDLSPLKTKWDFLPGRMEPDGDLETQGLNSTEVKLSMISHSQDKTVTLAGQRWQVR